VFSGTPGAAAVSAAIAEIDGPLAIVVDDAEAFARSEADDVVKEFARSTAGLGRVGLVVAGQLEEMKNEIRGVIVEAKKAKAGLLLSPSSSFDGELVSLRLPRNLTGRMPAGRGVLALNGEPTVVQVPLTG
jgi:S-DNA-T family DNA segregation ATPase FtsK/SpoIIIE